MKHYLRLVACVLFVSHPFAADEIHHCTSPGNYLDSSHETAAQEAAQGNSEFTIYYGLNDSHSRSWASMNNDGVLGVVYFQRFKDSVDQGILSYRTILPDGSTKVEAVRSGTRLEKSVLLFDAGSGPHIFTASSTDSDQIIYHYFKNAKGLWRREIIVHFENEGGRFIYEMSGDTGPDYSFHLLVLKTRSNVDSDDFLEAWHDSNLYHLTNASGDWQKELVASYDMVYTWDMYVKSLTRQDIKVDRKGFVHLVFGEQVNGRFENSPSRLCYATNKTGKWVVETASNYEDGSRDDAGWFPSLCLNRAGIPYISCMYVKRVPTGSAAYCRLLLLHRVKKDVWQAQMVADRDDGYYGTDGRNYTGALSHLVIDEDNTPHIVFSDVASSHFAYNVLNVGNIRYAVRKEGTWFIETIYRQPLPANFLNATEMYSMCLLLSEATNTIRVVGQELIIRGENQYTCRLVRLKTPSQ